jgi:predicted phosphoribosyltransferase
MAVDNCRFLILGNMPCPLKIAPRLVKNWLLLSLAIAPGVVYPLPRGGVVLGVEIACYLQMPLDLIIPRKIGHPRNSEYAIGAVTETGELICNEREVARVDPHWLEQRVVQERQEARRRRERYLGGRKPLAVAGKLAILVDVGIATGLTVRAARGEVKRRRPAGVVVAIPVAPKDTADTLAQEVDAVVGLEITDCYWGAVGAYYERFAQVTDDEVINRLQRQRRQSRAEHE